MQEEASAAFLAMEKEPQAGQPERGVLKYTVRGKSGFILDTQVKREHSHHRPEQGMTCESGFQKVSNKMVGSLEGRRHRRQADQFPCTFLTQKEEKQLRERKEGK